MGVVRFTVKSALVGGIVYYTVHEGLWSTPDESVKVYAKLYNTIAPYVKENVPKDIVDELPTLPSPTDISHYAQSGWNKGVMASFNFLANLPTHISNGVEGLTATVKKYLEEQPLNEKTQ